MTTQLDCSLGFKKETGYGAAIVVDRFPEFIDEGLAWKPTFAQGAGLRVGSRIARAARRKLVKDESGGDINVELVTKGMGFFFDALLGSSASTQIGTTTGYQQLFTLTRGLLPSYTIQKGIPPLGGGPTTALTFHGGICASGELTAAAGEIVKLKTTWDTREVKKDVAYAAPSYAVNPELYTFVDGAIAIGGSVTPPTATALATGGTPAANITEVSLSIDNKIDGGGWTLGGDGKRGRRPVVGLAEVKGKITAEFDTTFLQNAYLDQTPLSMLLTFAANQEISAGVPATLQIYIDDIRLDGELPKSNGGDVITQSIDFVVLDALKAGTEPLSIVYRTADTAL
ncbi:phage tail tube protein [Arthrobacter sp. Hz1]